MKIRLASAMDIDRVLDITRACDLYMRSNGIYQWTDEYPSRETFKRDEERKELYVLEKNQLIVGCIVISTYMDEIYRTVKWLSSDHSRSLYIHRIAVHPDEQKQGFAQQLMDYAEQHAAQHHYKSVRLDTFSQNPRNQKFYEIRGYQRLETIYFPQQSEHPFYCYEKLMES